MPTEKVADQRNRIVHALRILGPATEEDLLDRANAAQAIYQNLAVLDKAKLKKHITALKKEGRIEKDGDQFTATEEETSG